MKNIIKLIVLLTALLSVTDSFSQRRRDNDTLNLKYPFQDNPGLIYDSTQFTSPLMMEPPEGKIVETAEFDPVTGEYVIKRTVNGKVEYRQPVRMTLKEYADYDFDQAVQTYWAERAKSESFEHQRGLIPKLYIGGRLFETIFGSNTIDIKVRGQATLTFAIQYDKTDNFALPVPMRRNTTFDFKERIQINVDGKIGENLELMVKYDTDASFDFENKTNIRYKSNEDDIIQRIEAGDVTLPLTGSLIRGSQSLFGILTEFKFGKLNVTTLFSQKKSESRTMEVTGGAQKTDFKIKADEYDENRHYFISHTFRNNYEYALANLPLIQTGAIIRSIEVWVLNKSGSVDNTRNIVAFMDLAEGNFANLQNQTGNVAIIPGQHGNEANSLYEMLRLKDIRNISEAASILSTLEPLGFKIGRDYEIVENARRLNPSEYRFNSNLGYISLNSQLRSDEVLAIAYQYDMGVGTYSVGETSSDLEAPKTLIVKLIKGTSFSPQYKSWNLMMKNVYRIGGYQINKEDFILDIAYYDNKTGRDVYSLNLPNYPNLDKKPLLRLLNLDNLDMQNQRVREGDGVFDFVDGITIDAQRGILYFPVLEPFGRSLQRQFGDTPKDIAESQNYVFLELYDSTKTVAKSNPEKNKFSIQGTYKSAGGSEIMLNAMNIPRGSVTVTHGGQKLVEGQDYTVDYMMGRLTIIKPGVLESGTPVQVSLESQNMFSINMKRLMGAHVTYDTGPKFNISGTIMNLSETPITKKVNLGNEPINNTIWGLNFSYRTDAPFLTKLVDKIPLISTKAPSSISFEGEFAYLIPGHNKAIAKDKGGRAFIDDFEGTTSTIDLRQPTTWSIASTPISFDEGKVGLNDLSYRFKAAHLSWYVIDPFFYENNSPVSKNAVSSLYTARFYETQLFPNIDPAQGVSNTLLILNLAYYPKERGMYNYNFGNLNNKGELNNPELNWGGIQRALTISDFEALNIEFVEFWLMDPYAEDDENGIVRNAQSPALFINLGDVSEDVLKDGRRSFEQGLPKTAEVTNVETTAWGRVSSLQPITNSFDNGDPSSRQYQDIGMDGLNNADEKNHFASELAKLNPSIPANIRQKFTDDPSGDDFRYFRGDAVDNDPLAADNVTERYKYYSGTENNSPVNASNNLFTPQSSSLPDMEDINGDFTLNQSENYFEYRIDLSKENFNNTKRYIVDEVTVNASLPNGNSKPVKWYQFKVPVRIPDDTKGEISDYRSIRFMRMFMTGFDESVILRFARLGLVRSEWRRYEYVIESPMEQLNPNIQLDQVGFEVLAVNIEENSYRTPVNYVLPPGVDRELSPGGATLAQLNEQALALRVTDLPNGYAKAVYKNINMDMRRYGKIRMFAHAEAIADKNTLIDNEMTLFVRLGTDFRENYYEYEIPLLVTPPGRYLDNTQGQMEVWPPENNLDVALDQFIELKKNRNILMTEKGSTINYQTEYYAFDGKNTIKIKGNPNLAEVRSIMIGIRNPGKDNVLRSAEVWVNELALTNFVEDGGWAAVGRLSTQLADLANVTLAGSTSKYGFGSIEQRINERQKESINQYNISSNIELGKFFPQSANIRIPMYVGFEEIFVTPEFNPLDQDVPFEESLQNPNLTKEDKDYLRNIAQDYTKRKSLNFTNVKIGKPSPKPKFYSISNWNAGYSFTDIYITNPNTEYNSQVHHVGSLGYVYNNSGVKVYEPFKSVKMFSPKPLAIIKDINYSIAPNQLSFTTQLSRQYNEMLRRNLYNPNQTFNPSYNKFFRWTRNYQYSHNLARGIKFDFTSNVAARIEEPEGRLDKDMNDYYQRRDTILSSLQQLGTTTDYGHNMRISYNVPINKLPGFGWINANASYTGQYNWNIGPTMFIDSLDFGNTIQNSNTKQISLGFNFNRLLQKPPLIDNIHKKFKRPIKERFKEKDVITKTYDRTRLKIKAEERKTIVHNLGTLEVTAVLTGGDGKKVKCDVDIQTPTRIVITPETDVVNGTLIVTGKVERNQSPMKITGDYLIRIFTGLQNINITYSDNAGSMLDGYKPKASFFGTNDNPRNLAPGWGYIVGVADEDYIKTVLEKEWLSKNITEATTKFYTLTSAKNISLKATYEPLTDLQISIDWMHRSSENVSRQYFTQSPTNDFMRPPTIQGSYSVSYASYRTFLYKTDKKTFQNKAFDDFRKYRKEVAWQIANERKLNDKTYDPGTGNYPEGYNSVHPDVLLYSFKTAYAGLEPSKFDKGPGKIVPSLLSAAPGWRVDYKGLTKIDYFAKYFKSITLTHTYLSNFTMGSYQTNPSYVANSAGYTIVTSLDDTNPFYVPEYNANSVAFQESFNPLAGVNLTWKNSLTTGINYKKDRNIALNLTNNTLTELHTWDITTRLGYTLKEIVLVLKAQGVQRRFTSNVNVSGDFSIRNNVTYNRQISANITERTAGKINYAFKAGADYQFDRNLNMRVFYEHTIDKPWVSTSFRTVRARFGFTINYRLSE